MWLVLLASAFADPALWAQGTCPGTVTFFADELTPSGSFVLVAGDRAGRWVVPAGPCGGTELQLGASARLAGFTFAADANGQAVLMLPLPLRWCDSLVQAVDLTTCEPSPVFDLSTPQCNDATVLLTDAAAVTRHADCRVMRTVIVGDHQNPPAYTDLRLPRLVHVDQLQIPRPNQLAALELPRLQTVRDAAFLDHVSALQTLDMGDLEDVGLMSLARNQLASIDLPSLRTAQFLDLHRDGAIELPRLQSVDGNLLLAGDLTEIALPSLRYLGGSLEIADIPTLTSVSMPSLRWMGDGDLSSSSELLITRNGALHDLDIGGLEAVERLGVTANPVLCPEFSQVEWPAWQGLQVLDSVVVGANAPGCDGIGLP